MQLTLLNDKHKNRISVVLLHTFSRFLPSIGNLLLSVLVVRLFAPQWWGQISSLQLYQYIAVQIVAWGNKDVLLKIFSSNPASLVAEFTSSFVNRLWLLLPVGVVVFLLLQYNAGVFIHLSIWIVCRFVQESIETPALFQRKFSAIIVSEVVSIMMLCLLLLLFNNHSYNTILLIITSVQLLKTVIQGFAFSSLFAQFRIFAPDLVFFKQSLPFMLLGVLGILQQKADLWCVIYFTDDLGVAQYQVFTTFYLLALSIPALIAGPFVKNIYRISPDTFGKVEIQFAATGALINLGIILLSFICIEYVYRFHFDPAMYLLVWLGAQITYLFSLKVIRLYKSEKQLLVLGIMLSSVLLNIGLSVWLLPVMGLTGALIANVSAQVCLLLLFNRNSRRLQSA